MLRSDSFFRAQGARSPTRRGQEQARREHPEHIRTARPLGPMTSFFFVSSFSSLRIFAARGDRFTHVSLTSSVKNGSGPRNWGKAARAPGCSQLRADENFEHMILEVVSGASCTSAITVRCSHGCYLSLLRFSKACFLKPLFSYQLREHSLRFSSYSGNF